MFGFLANHPQLMGVGLILVGWFIKRTRSPSYVKKVFVADPASVYGQYSFYQPTTQSSQAGHYVDVIVPEAPGLDLEIWRVGSVADFANAIGTGNIASGIYGLFNILFPQFINAAKNVPVNLTLGDVLIAGGMAAVLGPALGSLIKL